MIVSEYNPIAMVYILYIYNGDELVNRVTIRTEVLKDNWIEDILKELKVKLGKNYQERELFKALSSIKQRIFD